MIDLLPCPHCEGADLEFIAGSTLAAVARKSNCVTCTRCDAMGPIVWEFEKGDDTEAMAARLWNQRGADVIGAVERFKREAAIAVLRTASRGLAWLRFPTEDIE